MRASARAGRRPARRLPGRRLARRLEFIALSAAALPFVVIALCWHLSPFPPARLDEAPASPRVTAADGTLLLATVAADDQWRLPVKLPRMSERLIEATVAVEDERFWSHPGVDPIAVVRAAVQDIAALRVVSGASTVTMQLCRLCRPRRRTVAAKAIESLRALQLERLWSKERILEAYLNRAPYGGNTVGVEAAAWRYFGKGCERLSLAEAALLAGLPQGPSLLRPDRHPERARARRDHVLERMREEGYISEEERRLAAAEPVVLAPVSRGASARHAAWMALALRPAGGCTTIDLDLQREAERIVGEELPSLPRGSDVAIVAIELAGGEIRALVGSADADAPVDGMVNGAMARRSPGSTLKPFVYAAAFDAGSLAADTLVPDIPIERAGWKPRNFDGTFAGEVTVAVALDRSLNVPAILTAEALGLERCAGAVESAGIPLPQHVIARGGLAIVTGAVEVRLVDLVNAYATLGRGGRYLPWTIWERDAAGPGGSQSGAGGAAAPRSRPVFSQRGCAQIDAILGSRARRPAGLEDLPCERVPWFMWKTGTSSKRRDAWAVGHNGRFAIGVWVGRFGGGGDPELVGALAAEPILARLFSLDGVAVLAAPPEPPPLVVTRPLRFPERDRDTLRIVSPENGARFIAVGGRAVVLPQCAPEPPSRRFLNGRLLEEEESARLCLSAGRYELRLVDATGASDAVRFEVR
ncbi:MAG: penicillin-binding protein 1C [Planctomycetota bacterium]